MESLKKALMVQVEFVQTDPRAKLPTRGSEHAAGWDLYAAEPILLMPGRPGLVKTGFRIKVPAGYEAQVRPRSGLALKSSVTVLNTPGTVDEDYRGQLGVILMNHGDLAYEVMPGDRIAQLVIKPVVRNVKMAIVQEFDDETERGTGGFGSSGR